MLKLLIDAGAELNATDNEGRTALMYAGDIERVRVLLNAGIDLTLKSKDGKTALTLAIENRQDDIAKVLKSRGAPQ
jgi:ankyrin repeat protein